MCGLIKKHNCFTHYDIIKQTKLLRFVACKSYCDEQQRVLSALLATRVRVFVAMCARADTLCGAPMMRYALLGLVLLLLALGVCAQDPEPTITSEDVQSMLDNTGIAPGGFCNAALNNYQVNLVNGLPINTLATLVLDCNGCFNTSITAQIAALRETGAFTITAPTDCVVTNRFCKLLMYVLNPYVPEGEEPEQVLVSQFESTCGVVPPNDYTAGCSWVDFACQMTNGEWYHYGPALCLYLGFVFVTMALGTAVLLVVEHNMRQFRLGNVAKSLTGNSGVAAMTFMEGVNVQFQTNTLNPLQARPKGYVNNSNASAPPLVKGGSSFNNTLVPSSIKHRGAAAKSGGSSSSPRPGEVSVTGLLQNMGNGGSKSAV